MPRLIHLAPDHAAKRIARTGIRATRLGYPLAGASDRAVWAFPILPSHTLTFQWLRELKRRWHSPRTLVAITFKVPDDQVVFVRYYNERPVPMTAALAVGSIRNHPSPLGYEIIVPRSIPAYEIIKIATPPQKIGWRPRRCGSAFPAHARRAYRQGCPTRRAAAPMPSGASTRENKGGHRLRNALAPALSRRGRCV
jgi:hypothetical protein